MPGQGGHDEPVGAGHDGGVRAGRKGQEVERAGGAVGGGISEVDHHFVPDENAVVQVRDGVGAQLRVDGEDARTVFPGLDAGAPGAADGVAQQAQQLLGMDVGDDDVRRVSTAVGAGDAAVFDRLRRSTAAARPDPQRHRHDAGRCAPHPADLHHPGVHRRQQLSLLIRSFSRVFCSTPRPRRSACRLTGAIPTCGAYGFWKSRMSPDSLPRDHEWKGIRTIAPARSSHRPRHAISSARR